MTVACGSGRLGLGLLGATGGGAAGGGACAAGFADSVGGSSGGGRALALVLYGSNGYGSRGSGSGFGGAGSAGGARRRGLRWRRRVGGRGRRAVVPRPPVAAGPRPAGRCGGGATLLEAFLGRRRCSAGGASGAGSSASVGGAGAGAPNVTKPVSERVGGRPAAAASTAAGSAGRVGLGRSGQGLAAAAACTAPAGAVSVGPGGAALPHGNDWNSSDTAASAGDVPSNGAGVSSFGVSTCSSRSGSRASRRQRGPSRRDQDLLEVVPRVVGRLRALLGSLTSSRSIQSEIAWSTDGSIDSPAGIGSLTWRSRIAIGASVSWNGTWPVNSSNAMQPTE